MSDFKAQVERDISAVFHNAEEFADLMEVEYNGKTYKDIPVVIDNEIAKEREKARGDNSVGIFSFDVTAFMSFKDLKIVPRKETKIVIGGVTYNIVQVAFDVGEITLDLELLEE